MRFLLFQSKRNIFYFKGPTNFSIGNSESAISLIEVKVFSQMTPLNHSFF